MSWIRSSKSTALLVLLIVSAAAVGTAAAVTVDSTDAPEEAEVGEEISVSMTLTDLYAEDDNWTLNGTTQLENVSGWTVTKIQPNGDESATTFEGQQNFSVAISSEENLDEVTVEITGEVPTVEEYSYRPSQEFAAAELDRVVGENVNEIETVSVHHYTSQSRATRNNIRDAEEVVNGSDSSDAQDRLGNAIDAFNGGNFEVANNTAEDAKNTAEEAQQSAQTMQLVLIGVGAVVVLVLIGGGIYYYRQQQDDYDKLR